MKKCFDRHHAGIDALRETIDVLSLENEAQRELIANRDGQLIQYAERMEEAERVFRERYTALERMHDERVAQLTQMFMDERTERKLLADRVMSLAGFHPIYSPLPSMPPMQQAELTSSEPVSGVYGDVNAYIKAAELAEAQVFADERKKLAFEVIKESSGNAE